MNLNRINKHSLVYNNYLTSVKWVFVTGMVYNGNVYLRSIFHSYSTRYACILYFTLLYT